MTPGESLRLAMACSWAPSIDPLSPTVATDFSRRPSVPELDRRAVGLGRPAVTVRAGERLQSNERARRQRAQHHHAAAGNGAGVEKAERLVAEEARIGHL